DRQPEPFGCPAGLIPIEVKEARDPNDTDKKGKRSAHLYPLSCALTLIGCIRLVVHKESVKQFQGEKFVNLSCVVAIALQMAVDHGLNTAPVQIWACKGARVEQHLFDVACQRIAVPDPVMVQLVPAEKDTLQPEWREEMIQAG